MNIRNSLVVFGLAVALSCIAPSAKAGARYTVTAVMQKRAIVKGDVKNLKVGDKLYGKAAGSAGRVVQVGERIAVVEFKSDAPLTAGEVLADHPGGEAGEAQAPQPEVAADKNPPEEREEEPRAPIADPNGVERLSYFVPRHKIFLKAGGDTTLMDRQNTKRSDGTDFAGTKSTARTADAEVSYGIHERVSLGLAFDYLAQSKSDTTLASTQQVTTAKASGASNPTVELKHRFLKRGSSGLAGDVSIAVAPSVVPAKAATDMARGTNSSASTVAGADANLFWGTGKHEVGLGVGAAYASAGDLRATPDSSGYHINARKIFAASVAFRSQLTGKLFVSPEATILFPYRQNLAFKTDPVIAEEFIVHPVTVYGATVGYKLGERALVFAEFALRRYSDDEKLIQTSGVATELENRYSTGKVAAGVAIQF